MELEKLDTLYGEIAQTINEMIPKEWEEVCLYAEILDDSAEINFYYILMDENEYRYSHNIPEDHQVSESIYNEYLIKLHDLFEELQQVYELINPEKWTNLTLKLDANGKFSLDLDYEDVLNQGMFSSEREVIWAYEHIGIYPKRESLREFLEEYIKNKEENN
ncbi:antitoxin YezG family protein [Bacillus safensis]|uniref:immunity protein YezG family protein n=1 Tax=Bacillus safensis TaxID=561879 RepID=UPI00203E89F2|nr:immunity protein YezG family protein [Bacillus safensis]MCM2988283.1 antitoxin YezG family protein [Bacillus safensis]